MNVLGIARTLQRQKYITLVILVLTVGACAYSYLSAPSKFQTTATYTLVNPTQPTAQQIAADPRLGRLNTDNPYLNFSDQSAVVSILCQRMSGANERERIVALGGNPNYVVAPSNEFSLGGRLVALTGTGPDVAGATRTMAILERETQDQLRRLQTVYGADSRYLIRALVITPAGAPAQQISGKLRSVISIFAIGIIVLFAAVSVGEAIRIKRGERSAARTRSAAANATGYDPDGEDHRDDPGASTPEPAPGTTDDGQGGGHLTTLRRARSFTDDSEPIVEPDIASNNQPRSRQRGRVRRVAP